MDAPNCDSRVANLSYDPKIPIQDILSALGQVGVATSFKMRRTENGIASLLVAFETSNEAQKAAAINYIRRPEFSLTRDVGTQTVQEDETRMRRASSSHETTRTTEPSRNSIQHVPTRVPRHEDEAYTRLFCNLPWYQDPEEREERLIRHFSKFGELMYHKVMNDRHGQLKLGYVCYYLPEHAAEAMRYSSRAYRARPAEPRKMSFFDRNKTDRDRQIRHVSCGNYVEKSVFHLHENTCRRLRAYRCTRESPSRKSTEIDSRRKSIEGSRHAPHIVGTTAQDILRKISDLVTSNPQSASEK